MLWRGRAGDAAVAVDHRVEGLDAAFRVPEVINAKIMLRLREPAYEVA